MNRDDDPGGIEWTSLCRYGCGSKLRRPLIVGWLEYQTCSQRCGSKIGTLNLSHSHVTGIHSPILFGPHQPVVLGGRLYGYPMPFLHHDSVENDPSLYGERSSCRDPPFRLNHDNRSKDRCYYFWLYDCSWNPIHLANGSSTNNKISSQYSMIFYRPLKNNRIVNCIQLPSALESLQYGIAVTCWTSWSWEGVCSEHMPIKSEPTNDFPFPPKGVVCIANGFGN